MLFCRLVDYNIFSRTGDNPVQSIGNIQDGALNRMLSTRSLSKLLDAEAALGSKAYQITELLSDLKKGIFSELPARKSIDIYRRNLQKSYVNILSNIINPPSSGSSANTISFGNNNMVSTSKSDIRSVVRAHLQQLRNDARTAATVAPDSMSRYHLQDLVSRIDEALDPKK